MGIITKMRKQTCVYWAFKNTESGGIAYDNYGQPQWTDPVEIECRWEDVNKEFMDAVGTRQLSNAIVYVDRAMKPGEVLFKGLLADLSVAEKAAPKSAEGAWEIKQYDELPTLRYKSATPDENQLLRTAYL